MMFCCVLCVGLLLLSCAVRFAGCFAGCFDLIAFVVCDFRGFVYCLDTFVSCT